MENTKMNAERGYFNKETDDDVSVIAVIGKENDQKVDVKRKDRRVFELGDERSKMALRKELDLEALPTEQSNAAECYQGMEILQKLPPGTIVIKKEKKYKDDSDYVRDSTETSSGGSTSGGATKVRKVHRTTRKTRGTTEVRRNPIRVTKKDQDKDFPRPRQRLLSAKRKEMLLDSEPSKRGKSSTMPYMNTRSVTRKMYNVGATYQAPTAGDETEWKEWPVHGMHERPIFHPQVGLAAEYLGRSFACSDGLSYREITDRPDIEVVSVDPRCDFTLSSNEKKRSRKTRANRVSSTAKSSKASTVRSSEQANSFEGCMHESFHCVLGYCSQLMTPAYKTSVEGKIGMLNDSRTSSNNAKELEKQPSMTDTAEQTSKSEPMANFKENLLKTTEESKALDNYTVAMFPQSIKNIGQIPKTRLFPAQKVYVANSQKSVAFTNLKTFQGSQMKIQEVVRSAKSPFILVNPAEMKEAQLLKPVAGNVNAIKMEESTNTEETLGELSSIYKNVSSEGLAVKQGAARRGGKVEFTVTKYLLDNAQQKNVQLAKESNSGAKKSCYDNNAGKELNVKAISGGLSKTWCASEATEIARILSEYNKSSSKKPAIESQPFYASMKNIRVKEICNKEDDNVPDGGSTERNMNITFPQGKWRRFHLTVEKLKNLKSTTNEKKLPSVVHNRQSLFKIDQPAITSDRKHDVPKQLESVQRGQASLMGLENKKNASAVNSSLDTAPMKTRSLQELLENTAMLYCAATGTHQDDLANYIDGLDAAQSIQWLESCNNLIV